MKIKLRVRLHFFENKKLGIIADSTIPKIPETDIAFLKTLGKGGQGEVSKVLFKGKLAAAKSIPAYHFQDPMIVSDFLHEIKLFRFIGLKLLT